MSKKGWSGQLFPRHVKPQADELLSSWLTRLSLAHGLEPRAFCTILWPAKQIGVGDIDHRATLDMLAILAEKTAISRRRAFDTTLSAYEGTLWDAYGPRHWLLLGTIQRQRRDRPGLQYCPQCLRADATPYFRRCWRLGFVTVCTDHSRLLLDRCPACCDPVNFHLLPYDTDTIARCHQCQFDLVFAESPALDANPAHYRLVTLQTMLLQALTTGWYPLAEDESVQLGHFLGVLRHLGRLLVRHRDADLHRARLCQRVKQPYFIPHLPSSPQWTLEGLSVTDRFRLLLLLAWWLEDWPDQFITVCLELPIWPRDLLRHLASPPLWYEQTVEKVTWSEAFKRALQEYNNEWNVP